MSYRTLRSGGAAERFPVGADEVIRISVAALAGDLFDGEFCFRQQAAGVAEPGGVQVFAQCHAAL